MKVLHYNLGLPPYRSGGMTNWSMDLINKQIQDDIDVTLLFPGEIKLMHSRIGIKKTKGRKDMSVFRLVNPLPVPLIYGIDSEKHYMNYDKSVNFKPFFKKYMFDVIHLHTLQGLPIEFIQQAKEESIRIIYTAHDMFGIWPEPNLGKKKASVDPIFNLGFIGNQNTLSHQTIAIMQSKTYRKLKNSPLFAHVTTLVRRRRAPISLTHSSSEKLQTQQLYRTLRNHYRKFFNLIDYIHFNSKLAKDTFRAYKVERPSFMSHVYHTHMPLKPLDTQTTNRNNSDNHVYILFNGTPEQYKGFPLLISTLDTLYANNSQNFTLFTYNSSSISRPYIETRPPYTSSELRSVYSNISLTVVPSLYCETFGMVAAESLSYGVPVLMSKMVGAQSLLRGKKYGWIFHTEKELIHTLHDILVRPGKLSEMRRYILAANDLEFNSNSTYTTLMQYYKKRALS